MNSSTIQRIRRQLSSNGKHQICHPQDPTTRWPSPKCQITSSAWNAGTGFSRFNTQELVCSPVVDDLRLRISFLGEMEVGMTFPWCKSPPDLALWNLSGERSDSCWDARSFGCLGHWKALG